MNRCPMDYFLFFKKDHGNHHLELIVIETDQLGRK